MEKTVKEIAENLCRDLNVTTRTMAYVTTEIKKFAAENHLPLELVDTMCYEDSTLMFSVLYDGESFDDMHSMLCDNYKKYEKNSFTLASIIKQCWDYAMNQERDADAASYISELDKVDDNVDHLWKYMVSTAVFHDAIGEIDYDCKYYLIVSIDY